MMKQPSIYAIQDIVPHSETMSLLDEVISVDDDGLKATAFAKENNPFLLNNQIPAWLCIEYMAQTISAWAGSFAKMRGEEIRLGFLVGTRNFKANFESISLGEQLIVSISKELYNENGLSVFSCHLSSGDMLATANINVFQPTNVDEFLDSNSE